MDGIHDLGGMQGFGRVDHVVNTLDYDNPLHTPWDHLGYTLAAVGGTLEQTTALKTWDKFRHAIERIDPKRYLESSYFDRVIIGVATAFVESGVITKDELDEASGGDFQLADPVISPGREATKTSQSFNVGDRVRTSDTRVDGHVRMPAFCRGRTGTVLHRTTKEWMLPDSIGHQNLPAEKQPTYHVEFDRHELWGKDAEPGTVIVDLFQEYLEPAS